MFTRDSARGGRVSKLTTGKVPAKLKASAKLKTVAVATKHDVALPKKKRASRLSIELRRAQMTQHLAKGGQSRQRRGNLSISFETDLVHQIQRAAGKEMKGNVSAWLAHAAREQLRVAAGWELIRDFEERHGAITDAELAEVDRVWPPTR